MSQKEITKLSVIQKVSDGLLRQRDAALQHGISTRQIRPTVLKIKLFEQLNWFLKPLRVISHHGIQNTNNFSHYGGYSHFKCFSVFP